MIYFQKGTSPSIFEQWKDENRTAIDAWINDPEKTGGMLWEQLGKTFGNERSTSISVDDVKMALLNAFYNEQHGLCCYCGNKIERTSNANGRINYLQCSIEHWMPKGKNEGKELTFEYTNLFLCCKESGHNTSEKKVYIFDNQLRTFSDIAKLTGIAEEIIKEQNPGVEEKLGNRVKILSSIHCDDAKSKNDSKQTPLPIINPTKHKKLIALFKYHPNGQVYHKASEDSTENELLTNTIFYVLLLNSWVLVERRKDKWKIAQEAFELWVQSEIGGNLEEWETVLQQYITQLISEKSIPDSDTNELDAFYFVEIAFLENLLTGN